MSSKTFQEQIDDYKDSICAIIGFVNLFRFDDKAKKMKPDVKVSQGRRMQTSASNKVSPNSEVTPDFCIQFPNNKGIVGEVKKSFPAKQDYWKDDFDQLMSYDDDFLNWLTPSGKIDDHEIVLLPEQSRSRLVKQYFKERNGKEITFKKNFIIVEFNRNDQVNSYFFFRKECGAFKYFEDANERLEQGVQVPLAKLMPFYEKIKLYDSKPPLPYLLHLIWENVILLRASEEEGFKGLHRNSRLPIGIMVDQIVNDLHENYSFKSLHSDTGSYQPKIPLKSWIKEAINALVSFKLAKWKDEASGECQIYFKKFRDTLKTFIDLCGEHKQGLSKDEGQMKLFDTNNNEDG
jgi:hypothetical protein